MHYLSRVCWKSIEWYVRCEYSLEQNIIFVNIFVEDRNATQRSGKKLGNRIRDLLAVGLSSLFYWATLEQTPNTVVELKETNNFASNGNSIWRRVQEL